MPKHSKTFPGVPGRMAISTQTTHPLETGFSRIRNGPPTGWAAPDGIIQRGVIHRNDSKE